MKPFVKVYDNVTPSYLADWIEEIAFKPSVIPWEFTPNISGVEGNNSFGFSRGLYADGKNEQNTSLNSPKLNLFFLQPFYNFLTSQRILLHEVYQSRLFLQTPSPTPGNMKGGIHTDMPIPHWVFIYYINDSDGDTVFFDQYEKEIVRVTPKKGRVALFDGSLEHTGSYPSKLRCIININFRAEFLENFN